MIFKVMIGDPLDLNEKGWHLWRDLLADNDDNLRNAILTVVLETLWRKLPKHFDATIPVTVEEMVMHAGTWITVGDAERISKDGP